MKKQLLCLPCTVRAAYDIAVKATDNESLRHEIVAKTIRWLSEQADMSEANPTVFHYYVFILAQKITGNMDPFKPLKKASNDIAMRFLPLLEREFRTKSPNEAFRLATLGAICGNTIDFEVEGYKVSVENIEGSLMSCLKGKLTIDDTPKLMKALSKARKALYLLDNAGK